MKKKKYLKEKSRKTQKSFSSESLVLGDLRATVSSTIE